MVCEGNDSPVIVSNIFSKATTTQTIITAATVISFSVKFLLTNLTGIFVVRSGKGQKMGMEAAKGREEKKRKRRRSGS